MQSNILSESLGKQLFLCCGFHFSLDSIVVNYQNNNQQCAPDNLTVEHRNTLVHIQDFILAVKETFDMFPNPTLSFTPEEWYQKVSQY